MTDSHHAHELPDQRRGRRPEQHGSQHGAQHGQPSGSRRQGQRTEAGAPHRPRRLAQVRPEAPAAVLMVDLSSRRVLYVNEVAAQLAPGLALPVSVDEWSGAADLRDLDGEPLDETAHPLSRIARFEPVAGQGVSAARSSAVAGGREPLWVVALPLDDAPNLRGQALVVFLPVRDREGLQERAEVAHARSDEALGHPGGDAELEHDVPARSDAAAVREAAVLATGLSFTVADAQAPDMPLVWVNPAFTATTGYTFERAVGFNCRFLQGAGTDPASPARMRAALQAGESTTETLLNYRADGTAFWNLVAMSPIKDTDGVITHYVGIQTDVSGRVAADEDRYRALAAEQAARAEAEAAHARLALLAEVTRQLSEVVDPEQALEQLAHLVVPVLADFVVLAFVGDDTVLTRGPGPTGAGSPRPVSGGNSAAAAAGAVSGGSRPARRRSRHGLRDVAWWHADPTLQDVLAEYARVRLSELSELGQQALSSLLGPGAAPGLRTAGGPPGAAPQAAGAASTGTGAGSPAQAKDRNAFDLEDLAATQAAATLLQPGPGRESLARLAPSWMITLPLRSRGRTLGLLTLGAGADRAPLAEDDVALACDIATRAGLALDRARLYRQQRDLAEGLQQSLLQVSPHAAPEHVRFAVRYVAAAEAAQVGGDFYDVFTQPGGSAVAVIGDVMGHDTQAAAAMAQLRTIVRTLGMVGDADPAEVLSGTDAMMRASGVDTTATATIVRVTLDDPATGSTRVEWSNAGHPPPLVIGEDGQVRFLEAAGTDLLLGVDPTTGRRVTSAVLAPGTTLLLYTDGLVERRDQPLSEGLERLRAVAADAALVSADHEELLEAVLAGMLPAPSPDDVAVVALCTKPAAGVR